MEEAADWTLVHNCCDAVIFGLRAGGYKVPEKSFPIAFPVFVDNVMGELHI